MSLLRPNIPLCLWCGRGEGIHQMAKRLPRPIANKSPIANHPPWNSKCLPVHPTTKITTQDEEQVRGKHHRNAKPIPNSPKTIPNLFFRGNRNHHSQNKCKKNVSPSSEKHIIPTQICPAAIVVLAGLLNVLHTLHLGKMEEEKWRTGSGLVHPFME